MMFAVFGMMLFPAANDLLTMFVGLEVLSLPLYLLSGLARRRRLLSQEAALKYFLLGAFSSGFFLYGAALLYGFAGALDFAAINEAVRNDVGNQALLLIGTGLLSVGLLFKVGAVPFQAWTPDVYQGAPTPVTAFMAAGTKVAAFGAMMRLFYVALGADRWSWQPMLWIIAMLSMFVGAVLAITQTDIKRLLAYSSVAHTGFILTGVLGLQAADQLAVGEISSVQAVLFYLATYGFATIGAFAVVSLVRDGAGEATAIDRWAGLGKESPVVAAVFAFFLLAMAGIPLTSGFVGKLAVFSVALAAGAWPVVVAAVVASIIAAFLYVRVIKVMYFDEPVGDGPTVAYPSVLTATTIAVGAAITARPRRAAGAGARSRGCCGRIHQVTDSAPLALPVVDAALEQRLVERLARIEEMLADHCRARTQFVSEAAAPPDDGRRQALPTPAGAAGRGGRPGPRRGRGRHRRLRRRAHPRRLALPRRRDGRGGPAPRGRHGQRALGQPRRDPHRRLPVRPVLRAHRRPGARGGPHPGADLHPAGRGPDPRDRRRPARARTRSRTTSRSSPARPAR